MPRIAREALIQRLYHSGLFDRLQTDVRVLFRKRLRFLGPDEHISGDSIEVPLVVGAVHLGKLGFKASARKERNDAYRRWLQMATRIFAEELSTPQAHSIGAVPAKIVRAVKLISEHHRDILSLGHVAEEVELSRERLSRLFHESMGITFSEYLVQARLNTARKYLSETEKTITEIAYESGFQSLSQFNRSFAKLEGQTPSAFRKSKRPLKTKSRVEHS